VKVRSRTVWGWAFYDWANSAFATSVMAGFFPIFFKSFWSAGTDVNLGTARLGLGNSLASLFVALLAPVLGAVADRGRAKKKFLVAFACLGVVMTASLFFIGRGEWLAALLIYTLALLGFFGANIFYDALLPAVADETRIDRVSGLGYAMGYLGGGLLFLLNVVMAVMPGRFGLRDETEAVRLAFPAVALWWAVFSIPLLVMVSEGPAPPAGMQGRSVMVDGVRRFVSTLKKIRSLKTVFLFLAAYWFYIDGVDSIIRMAVDYGLSLGFASRDLIVALLITQFVGFPAALVFGELGKSWGVRKSLFLAIGVYMCITLWGVWMTERWEFYMLACLIGLVQGGIQALSRSYYARLIPAGEEGEFFGFYNMFGKFAAILGPALIAGVGLLVKRILRYPGASQEQLVELSRTAARCGIGSLLLLFLAGAILLCFLERIPSTPRPPSTLQNG
jgi:UMF1 family MFS transporter